MFENFSYGLDNYCVCGLDECNDCDKCDVCVSVCDCNTCKCSEGFQCDYCERCVRLEKLDLLHQIRINGSSTCGIDTIEDILWYEKFYTNDNLNRLVFIKSVNGNVIVVVYDYARFDDKVYDFKDFVLNTDFFK